MTHHCPTLYNQELQNWPAACEESSYGLNIQATAMALVFIFMHGY